MYFKVTEMNRLNIPHGPNMVTLEKMRNPSTLSQPTVPKAPTEAEIQQKIEPALKELQEVHSRCVVIYL